MVNKKITIFGIAFLFAILIFSGFVKSETAPSYCCEKTVDLSPAPGNQGGSCMDLPEGKCDTNYKAVPTACSATSYCKVGTCIDEREGDCTQVPKASCDAEGGIWKEQPAEELAQCQLGCCLIGSQAAFVTPTRCSHLSSLYGLQINFRKDIPNEFACIASILAELEGACVIDREFGRTCKRTTRQECNNFASNQGDTSFYEGYLCSNEELGVDCGPSDKTTCVDGKDGVYYLDTCGNLANIFDAEFEEGNKEKNPDDFADYWGYIAGTHGLEVTCSDGNGNKDSATCGDCDYYSGSTCKKGGRGDARPGDYLCKDLGCKDEGYFKASGGKQPEHGESWCEYYEPETTTGGINLINLGNVLGVDAFGKSNFLGEKKQGDKLEMGGRFFRKICYNGEVTIEPCADFRQEVCIQSSIGDFKTAACRVNKWQDCVMQNDSEHCENFVQRDCKWVAVPDKQMKTEEVKVPILGIGGDTFLEDVSSGRCVPKYTPGFNFWGEESDASASCAIGGGQCLVLKTQKFKQGGANFLAIWQPVDQLIRGGEASGIETKYEGACIDKDGKVTKNSNWNVAMNNVCSSLGDCNGKITSETEFEEIAQEGGKGIDKIGGLLG